MIRRTGMLVILGTILALSAAALGARQRMAAEGKVKDQLPSIDEVLDKYIEAIGGKAAIEKRSSAVAKGSIEIVDPSGAGSRQGVIETYSKAPDKVLLIIRVPGQGPLLRQGSDGNVSWQKAAGGPLTELSGADLAQFKRDTTFHRSLKLRELYPRMQVKGRKRVEKHDTVEVVAYAQDGSRENWFFDAQSGLLSRTYIDRNSRQTDFDDYREVGGIKVPFFTRQTNPEFTLVIKLAEVQQNVPVDDTKFARPAR